MMRCPEISERRAGRVRRPGVMMIAAVLLGVMGVLLAMQNVPPAPTLALTNAQQQWLDAHPVIRLGPYRNYAPAQFVDDEGVHRGIAADYVELVQAMLGIQFTDIATETWQDLLDKAQTREIDVIALAAETADRKHYLSFTAPYLDLPAVIIARDIVDRKLSSTDLEGMDVCVVAGYAVQEYLEERHPKINLDLVPDTRTGLRKVSLGMADAFISDLAVASHFIEEEAITNLRVVGESGYVYRMGFAVRNDWPELVAMIDQALQEVTPAQSRTIFNRWISLSHETEFASRRLLTTLIAGVAAVTIIAVGIGLWNRSLKRRVNRKTQQLKDELAERQRVADALRTSEERIRLLIDTALDAVITMDASGSVTEWSKQAEAIFGWSAEEMVGQNLSEFIIPQQYRDAHRTGLQKYHETGEGPVLNQRIEITGLHRDGHEFPIELAISPIPTKDSIEFGAFVRDITVRKKTQEELQVHRDQLEELVVERTAKMQAAKDAAELAESRLAQRFEELEQAMAEVKELRGLLPICSYCKRIREGEDYTRSVEAYLAEHTDATFSHGICPDCYKKFVEPDLEQL